MVSGSFMDGNGLLRKYGTLKAVPTTAGDYVSLGETRVIEAYIPDLTTLTTSAAIINDVTWVGAGVMIESVEIIADTAATSGGSATLSIGLMKNDRSTTISDTALVSALALTAIDGTGEKTILTAGSTSAGTKVGTTTGADTGYITAKYGTAVFTAGAVRIRIKYRGVGTITQ